MIEHEWESGPWTGISVPVVERDGTTDGLRIFVLLHDHQVVRATLDVPMGDLDWANWATGTEAAMVCHMIGEHGSLDRFPRS
ncbi:MAG: hypothetical protein RIE08_02590 [Acidimicrobiales bacterium]